MAGRSIGNVEVTVDADTGRLKAQLVKDGQAAGRAGKVAIERELKGVEAELAKIDGRKEAELVKKQMELALRDVKAQVQLDFDFNEARTALRRFEAEAEATEVAIGASVSERDLAEINAELEALTAADREGEIQFEADLDQVNLAIEQMLAEQKEAEIQFEADLAQINVGLEKFRQQQERDAINLRIEGDLAAFDARFQAVLRQIEHTRVDVRVGAEVRDAVAEIEALQTLLARNEMSFPVEADLARARIALATFRELQERNDIEIPVDLDTSGIEAAIAEGITPQMAAAGRAGGDSAGSAFLDGFSNRLKLISGAVVVLMEPAMNALVGLVGGAVEIAGSGFLALTGSIVGAGAALGALGTAIGTFLIGTQGMGDAIEGLSEAMDEAAAAGRRLSAVEVDQILKDLAPAAQDTVVAIVGLRDEWDNLTRTVQQRLFAGVAEELESLANETLPELAEGFGIAATEGNQFFQGLADEVRAFDFGELLTTLRPALEDMSRGILGLVSALSPLMDALAPAILEVSESIADTAVSLAELISAGAESGELTDFFLDAVEATRTWWDLLRPLGDALFTILRTGAEEGNSMVESLARIVQSFSDWLDSTEGQDALIDFFETSSELVRSLAPVFEGLAEAIGNMVTPESVDRFAELADAIGKALPGLGTFFETVGEVGALQTMVDLLRIVSEALDEILPALQPVIDAFGEFRDAVLDAVEPAVDAFVDAFVPLIEELAPTFVDIFGELAEIVEELAPILGEMAEPLARLAVSGLEVLDAFSPLIILFLDAVGDVLPALVPLVKLAADAMVIFSEAIEGVLDVAGVAVTFLAGPFVAAFAGIGAAVGALGDLGGESVNIAPGITALAESVRLVAEAAQAAVAQGALESAVDAVADLGIESSATAIVQDALAEALARQAEEAAAAQAGWEGLHESFAPLERVGRGAVQAFADVAREASNAATSADALRSSFDLLVSPAMNAQEAADNFEQSIDDIAERIAEAKAGTEGYSLALDNSTEAGRANREEIRGGVNDALAFAAAQIEAGASLEETAAQTNNLREQLIQQVEQFGLTREEAESYINELGLTPETISTLVQQPGMLAAIENARIYDHDLDGVPNEIDTDFSTPGLADANTAVNNYDADLDGVPDNVETDFHANTGAASSAVSNYKGQLDRLDGRVVTTTMRLKHENVAVAAGALLDNGMVRAAAGRILSGPTVLAGESGVEAVIPLNRALSMIDPSVRQLAAILRGVEPHPNFAANTGVGIGKQVNQNITVVSQAADPIAVATQVMNRAAAMAI